MEQHVKKNYHELCKKYSGDDRYDTSDTLDILYKLYPDVEHITWWDGMNLKDKMFVRFQKLKVVDLSGLANLTPEVFFGSSNLLNIQLDSNNVPENIFMYTRNLRSVVIYDTDVFGNILHGLDKLNFADLRLGTGINQDIFQTNINLTSVRVRMIDDVEPNIFKYNPELTSINITCARMSHSIFTGLEKLRSVDICIEHLYIDSEFFRGCDEIRQIHIRATDSLIISSDCLRHLTKLKKIYINAPNNFSLRRNMFKNTPKLQNIEIRGGVVKMDSTIFNCLPLLKHIRLSIKNKKIFNMFDYSSKLTKVQIDAPIDEIPSTLFDCAKKLQEVSICETNLKEIPRGLFKNLSQLQNVIIHHNPKLEHIDEYEFKGKNLLNRITLSENRLTHLGENMFQLPNLECVDIEKNMIEILPLTISKYIDSIYFYDNPIKDFNGDDWYGNNYQSYVAHQKNILKEFNKQRTKSCN